MLLCGTTENAFWEIADRFPGGIGGSGETRDHDLLAQARTFENVPGQEWAETTLASQVREEILWWGIQRIEAAQGWHLCLLSDYF